MTSRSWEHGELEIRTTTTTTTRMSAAGDVDDNSGSKETTTAAATTTAHVIRTLYASTRHTSAYPYLVIILGSDTRDGKQLIVIVKRAARISVISYFLSSWSHSRLM